MAQQDAQRLNLYQKLAKIRAMSDAVKKSKKGYNYTYSDITEILANVTGGMKKYEVSLVPQIVPGTANVCQNVLINTKTDKTGKTYDNTTTEMLFTADMTYVWINDENPSERIEVPWFVTGSMADCAQAMGAGLTYTTRQFLTAYFQIAQSDNDVDAYRKKQKEAEDSEDKSIAAEIINEFDGVLKKFLPDHQDKTDEIKAFISRFVKNGNYFTIKDPVLAAKLLNDFKDKYIKEKK